MNRRRAFFLGSALLLPLGALAHLGCVGDAPVTPGVDAGPDVGGDTGSDVASDVSKDVGADAAAPLLACLSTETLETFDDPMGGPGVLDFCFTKYPPVIATCDTATTLGLKYSAGVLQAAATSGPSDMLAFADRAMDLGKVAAAALVTFEVSIDSLVGADAGAFSGLGCFIDLDTYNDAGVASLISRVDLVTDDKALFASTWVNTQIGRTGGTQVAVPGFSRTDPMTVTISVDRRAAPTAKVDVSSNAGSGSVNLSPTAGSVVAVTCGADRVLQGNTKVTIRKIRYARCVAK